MTIRTRILLVFILAVLLISSGVIGYATVQMRDDAQDYYVSSSSAQLRLMNDYIETFMSMNRHKIYKLKVMEPLSQ